LFWVLSAFDGVILIIGYFVLKETHGPTVARKHNCERVDCPIVREGPVNLAKVGTAMLVPLNLLARRPIIQLVSFLMGVSFGTYFLVLTVYATLFIDHYHETSAIASLHYIAIGLGAAIAAQGGGRLMDFIYARLSARWPQRTPVPEYRVPNFLLGAALLPVGMLWLGWSAETHAPWAVVDLGTIVFATGSFMAGQAMLAYLLDEFPHNTASASAATRVFSYILGFVFPLFAPQLFEELSYGWSCSVLALVWSVLAFLAAFAAWFWGAKLRAIGWRSKAIAA
jgi:hypothetical protein